MINFSMGDKRNCLGASTGYKKTGVKMTTFLTGYKRNCLGASTGYKKKHVKNTVFYGLQNPIASVRLRVTKFSVQKLKKYN